MANAASQQSSRKLHRKIDMSLLMGCRGRLPSSKLAAALGPESNHDGVEHGEDECSGHKPLKLGLDHVDHGLRRLEKLRMISQHFTAEPGQDRAPKARSDESHRAESGEIHPEDPGRNRNEMPDHRQQPREKNAAETILL